MYFGVDGRVGQIPYEPTVRAAHMRSREHLIPVDHGVRIDTGQQGRRYLILVFMILPPERNFIKDGKANVGFLEVPNRAKDKRGKMCQLERIYC